MSKLHNYMEDVVSNLFDDMSDSVGDVCKCSKCRLDILAIALNNLPSRYVVTERGRVYAKLDQVEIQFKADVARELTKAVAVVKTRPQH
jgi:competence protein ComFB